MRFRNYSLGAEGAYFALWSFAMKATNAVTGFNVASVAERERASRGMERYGVAPGVARGKGGSQRSTAPRPLEVDSMTI